MFDRLMGLETEYALRFHARTPGSCRVPNGTLVERLVHHVRSKVPVVRAIIQDYGWFTANGGAVRYERLPLFGPSAGLVEGATPECRGPLQLLRYQRAQDVLLSRAAAASGGTDGDVTLVKNNRDSRGNTYGCHENYEAAIASGAALWFWRLGLILLLPVLAMAAILALAPVLGVAAPIYGILIATSNQLRRGGSPPAAWEAVLGWLIRLCLLPVMLVGEGFVRLTAFRRQRRQLLAFLVSRPVLAGAGTLGPDGRFGLSPRATVVRSVCGMAAECYCPVFYFGHVFKGTLGVLLGDLGSYVQLFGRRQRMQISIGDSNMAQTAEYLKVGTTLLVLDAIEAGALADAPRLRRPLRAFRAICADPDLRRTVPLSGGRRWTALQIQRFYLTACRRFVLHSGRSHAEAEAVLRLWEETLDALEEDPRCLFGQLDWVTKRCLLETAGRGASADAKRKIDLRYHELSREGYYVQLEAAGAAPTLVEPEDVLRATEVPPEGTPASLRGRMIRESVAAQRPVRAGWHSVILNSGKRVRVAAPPDGD